MYVCMYVHVCVCMYVCMYLCVCMHVCMYVCYIFICVLRENNCFLHTHNQHNMYTHMHTHTHVHTHTHTHMHTHTHTHTHTHVHTHLAACVSSVQLQVMQDGSVQIKVAMAAVIPGPFGLVLSYTPSPPSQSFGSYVTQLTDLSFADVQKITYTIPQQRLPVTFNSFSVKVALMTRGVQGDVSNDSNVVSKPHFHICAVTVGDSCWLFLYSNHVSKVFQHSGHRWEVSLPFDTLIFPPPHTPLSFLPPTHPYLSSSPHTLIFPPPHTPLSFLLHTHTLIFPPPHTPLSFLPPTHPYLSSPPHTLIFPPPHTPLSFLLHTHPYLSSSTHTPLSFLPPHTLIFPPPPHPPMFFGLYATILTLAPPTIHPVIKLMF